MLYTVASPLPTSPRKSWEGTLRELPGQQQLLRGPSPLQPRPQEQSAKRQQEDMRPHSAASPSQNHGNSQPSKTLVQSQLTPKSSPVPQKTVQQADKGVPAQQWEPRKIDRAISAQEWEAYGVAAELNGQSDMARVGKVTAFDTGHHRDVADGSSLGKPHPRRLPEAESYEMFKILAHAFRQWRHHAETISLNRFVTWHLALVCYHKQHVGVRLSSCLPRCLFGDCFIIKPLHPAVVYCCGERFSLSCHAMQVKNVFLSECLLLFQPDLQGCSGSHASRTSDFVDVHQGYISCSMTKQDLSMYSGYSSMRK